jgi:hypothetical protein
MRSPPVRILKKISSLVPVFARAFRLRGCGQSEVDPDEKRNKGEFMKSTRNFTLLKLAMGSLLAICFNAGVANAQTVVGKFTLPFETHWGQATLPAGDYSFWMERGPGAMVQIFRAAKGAGIVMDLGYDYVTDPTGPMSLTVVRNRAGNTVRALNLPPIGKILHYAPNKPARSSAAGEREIAQLITVRAAGR